MSNLIKIWLWLFVSINALYCTQNDFSFNGTLSNIVQLNDAEPHPYFNLQYLPKIDYRLSESSDIEVSGNVFSNSQQNDYSSLINNLTLRPYRVWIRFSNDAFEGRLGLQKINFGPGRMLRSLMWFDQIDPRDPLRFTNGVYALRLQYYFQNNANIWFWGLYGNEDLKGLEQIKSDANKPEFGGRFQYPVGNGELAVTAHHRTLEIDEITESRIALDGFFDIGVGLWFESALVSADYQDNELNFQSFLTVGSDYTIPKGNGISIIAEHLFFSISDQPFNKQSSINLTSLSFAYPLGMFDQISYFNYFNWEQKVPYHYFSWQRTYDRWVIQCSSYLTTGTQSFGLNSQRSMPGKKGIQLAIIFNH